MMLFEPVNSTPTPWPAAEFIVLTSLPATTIVNSFESVPIGVKDLTNRLEPDAPTTVKSSALTLFTDSVNTILYTSSDSVVKKSPEPEVSS